MPLVDTGVLLSAIAPREVRHAECVAALRAANGPLLTTTAVLTELFYFVHQHALQAEQAWRFFSTGFVRLAPIDAHDLPSVETLMLKYADRPMDFADATLVHVAGREGIADILTIDHADFETYRFGRNPKFLPGPARWRHARRAPFVGPSARDDDTRQAGKHRRPTQ